MPRKYTPESRIQAFWKKVDKSGGDDACWIWTGMKKSSQKGKNYGRMLWNGTSRRAHRISFELTYGTFPEHFEVCHSCDNPPCVNPRHLFLGTHQDNMDDMKIKGRQVSVHGEKHKRCKISDEKVFQLRQEYLNGKTLAQLSRDFQISPSQTARIVKCQSRKT